MSHLRVKTKYMVADEYPGGYVMKEVTLYAHHNLSNDCVSFYDENGQYLFGVSQDTEPNNIIDAINRLWRPERRVGDSYVFELNKGVEYMTPEDTKKCGI